MTVKIFRSTGHIREEAVRNEDSESIVQVCANRTELAEFAWVAGKTKRQSERVRA